MTQNNIDRLYNFFAQRWLIMRLAEATPELTEREMAVLRERFWSQKTLVQVGRKLNISRERVKQIELTALDKVYQRWDHRFAKAVEVIEEILNEL